MKCTYCLAEIKKGTGLMYVYRIGDTAFYCSNSCFKNDVVMGRKPNRKLVASPAVKKVEKKEEKKEAATAGKREEKPAQAAQAPAKK